MRQLLGRGIVSWASDERTSNRYGGFALTRQSYDGQSHDYAFVLYDTVDHLLGKRVHLYATVAVSRKSGHLGDLALKILPTQPDVGEVVDLGVGILAAGEGPESGVPVFLLMPGDKRDVFWMDPHKLYRLHDQTIELSAEETNEDFSPAPDIPISERVEAYDTGDGNIQLKNVRAGQKVRVFPRPEKIGDGLFVMNPNPGFGERLKAEIEDD